MFTAASVKLTTFWDIVRCGPVEVDFMETTRRCVLIDGWITVGKELCPTLLTGISQAIAGMNRPLPTVPCVCLRQTIMVSLYSARRKETINCMSIIVSFCTGSVTVACCPLTRQ
jgi:hypothetical protein